MVLAFLTVLFGAFMQALISTLLVIFIALPIAHFFYLYDFFGKRFFMSLFAMFSIMPTRLVAICVSLFYGVTGFGGILLSHFMLNMPFALYILNSTYQKLDAALLWLAAESGASTCKCYKDIIFPMLKNTVISIFFLLFSLHFSSFSIPLILGRRLYHNTPEVMIYRMYNSGQYLHALIYWIIRSIAILILLLVYNKYTKQEKKISRIQHNAKRSYYSPGKKHSIYWLLYNIMVMIMLLGPIIALFVKAYELNVFNFFISIFSIVPDKVLDVAIFRVVINSILLGLASSVGAIFFAFFIGISEINITSWLGRMSISCASIATLIIGSIGCGILFAWISFAKVFSSFMISFLCHVILNYVFAYKIIKSQLIAYHSDLHKTAQAYGATSRKALWTVAWPFVIPSLYKAFGISFGLSLTEVGAGTVLEGKVGLTIPMAIRIYRQCGNEQAVIGLSLIVLSLVCVLNYFFLYQE